MSRFMIGNVFLVISMVCAASSQILIKALIDEVRPGGFDWSVVRSFMSGERLVRGGGAGVLLVAGFLFWILSLGRLDLSYAYPVACTSVLLISFFSVVFLGETMTARMWAGTALIVVGMVLLTPGH